MVSLSICLEECMYKLIIVDDESSICEGIAACYPWAEMGFEVSGTFPNGKNALDYIERYLVDVDVYKRQVYTKALSCSSGHYSGRNPHHTSAPQQPSCNQSISYLQFLPT